MGHVVSLLCLLSVQMYTMFLVFTQTGGDAQALCKLWFGGWWWVAGHHTTKLLTTGVCVADCLVTLGDAPQTQS